MADDPQLFDTSEMDAQVASAAKALKLPRVKDLREFGGWTIHKLDVLRLYLNLYRQVAGGGTYVDGFAGEGQLVVDGQTKPGSAGIAARAGAFKRLLFYELPEMAAKLERWLDANLTPTQRAKCEPVRRGDFNANVHADLREELVPYAKPCFAFLDPNATELHWTTIEALAAYKAGGQPPTTCKVELWVLFNTHHALMRLMPREVGPAFATSPEAAVLDRWMGGRDEWWDLFEQGGGPGLFAGRYATNLQKKLGYGAARTLRIIDRSSRRPQYYMVHASDHHKAFEFMQWAERNSAAGGGDELRFPGVAP